MIVSYDDEDIADTVRALADDFLTEHGADGDYADVGDVYDWLIARADQIHKPATTPGASA